MGGADEVRVFILSAPSLLGCLELLGPSTYDPGTPQNSGQLGTTVFQGPGKGSRQNWKQFACCTISDGFPGPHPCKQCLHK